MGGALGSMARYGISRLMPLPDFQSFPWAVFLVNISGCLLIGVLNSLIPHGERYLDWRLLLLTGLLGGYTTFSSFGLEFWQLTQNKATGIAVLYALGTTFAGLAAVFTGTWLTK